MMKVFCDVCGSEITRGSRVDLIRTIRCANGEVASLSVALRYTSGLSEAHMCIPCLREALSLEDGEQCLKRSF